MGKYFFRDLYSRVTYQGGVLVIAIEELRDAVDYFRMCPNAARIIGQKLEENNLAYLPINLKTNRGDKIVVALKNCPVGKDIDKLMNESRTLQSLKSRAAAFPTPSNRKSEGLRLKR